MLSTGRFSAIAHAVPPRYPVRVDLYFFALFFSLYTHLYRWRRSRNGSPARLAIASVVLSVLVAFIGTFLVGHFFDIEKSVFFLILTTLLTIIDLICSKPWKELDEIDRTCR